MALSVQNNRRRSFGVWLVAPVLLIISIIVLLNTPMFKPDEFGGSLLLCGLAIFWLSVASNLCYLGHQVLIKILGYDRSGFRVSQVRIIALVLSIITFLTQILIILAYML